MPPGLLCPSACLSVGLWFAAGQQVPRVSGRKNRALQAVPILVGPGPALGSFTCRWLVSHAVLLGVSITLEGNEPPQTAGVRSELTCA